MGRKEGAAGRQHQQHHQHHTRTDGDFEPHQEKKKKKNEEEKSSPRRARAHTRRRGLFFFAGVRWEGRGAGAVEKVDGMGWELSGGGWRWFAVFWGGERVAEGQLVPLVRMGSGGGGTGGRGGAGRSTREGGGRDPACVCVRQKVWEGSD